MLEIKNISFGYSNELVLKNIDFSIKKGAHVSIIGASGCGKSTLLQSIYGLHHVKGKIFWNKKQLLGPNFNLVPGEDFIKYLAQDFDLMLPLTVAENVGKHLSNMYPVKKERRIKELLKIVEMDDLAGSKAGHLSGGQQQRIALARVLAKEPEVLLLDEPFSHIDHFRKNKLRRKLFSYLREKQITCLTATHDSTDALSFADETLVMKSGKIVAKGTPKNLYQHPINAYVASLFGEVNVLPLHLLLKEKKSRKKIILYPHEIKVAATSDIEVKVVKSYFKGSNYLIEAELKGRMIYFENPSHLAEGKLVSIDILDNIISNRI